MIRRSESKIRVPEVVGCVYRHGSGLLVVSERIMDDVVDSWPHLWRVRVVNPSGMIVMMELFNVSEHDGVIAAVMECESMTAS